MLSIIRVAVQRSIKLALILAGVALVAGMAFVLGMYISFAVMGRTPPEFYSLPLTYLI